MISRDELYVLVWSKPMTKVAEQFGVSGSYLARICTLVNVPRPERGYWAKAAVNKAPPQTPLPPPQPGDPQHWSKEGEQAPVARPRTPPRHNPKKKVQIAFNQVHGVIRGAKSHFENGRKVEEGAYLKPYKRLLVDVTASKEHLDKALTLANDLFNALESVDHRVVIAPANAGLRRRRIEERETAAKSRDDWQYSGLWSPDRPTVVYIGTVSIGLAIVEMSENVMLRYVHGKYIRESEYVPPRSRHYVDHTWTTTRDLPSGRMRIVAYSPYGEVHWSTQWQETKSAPLGSQIRTIVEAIEAMAPDLVAKLAEADRHAKIRHQEWLAAEERRNREADRRRVEKSITDSETELHQIIEQWSNVVGIERFLSGVEQKAHSLPDIDRLYILERLALARSVLGTQDPLDFFRNWKTPRERYKPQYENNEPGAEALDAMTDQPLEEE